MEQNNYLEFEKSKAAVYTIMEACFRFFKFQMYLIWKMMNWEVFMMKLTNI